MRKFFVFSVLFALFTLPAFSYTFEYASDMAALFYQNAVQWKESAEFLKRKADLNDYYDALVLAKTNAVLAGRFSDYLTPEARAYLADLIHNINLQLQVLQSVNFKFITEDEIYQAYKKDIEEIYDKTERPPGEFYGELIESYENVLTNWREVKNIYEAMNDAENASRAVFEIESISSRLKILKFKAEKIDDRFEERELPAAKREGIVDMTLPFESRLVISGRKYVAMTISGTKYTDRTDSLDDPSSTSVNIQQQLQVRIRGTISDTTKVNIDYDDAKPEVERQTISVTYDGHTKKTKYADFQTSAAFGDITLSLPGTEFVAYNKNLFGASFTQRIMNLNLGFYKAEEIKLDVIATRTKGLSGRKVFKGDAATEIKKINDISFIKRVYYTPVDNTGIDSAPLILGSLKVYRDNRNADLNNENTIIGMTVTNGSDSYTGDFDVLTEGTDYTVDYRKGEIRFRSYIASNYVIAVDYKTRAGADETLKMIKNELETEKYDKYHIRNKYDLGVTNILRDDPDFIFEIWDENNNYYNEAEIPYIQVFGLDQTGPGADGIIGTDDDEPDGRIDDEFIDYEFGIVTFPDSMPFSDSNPSVYTKTPTAKYLLHLEYKHKVQSYLIGKFNIIRNSEKITIDGEEIPSSEYFIDYESGFITFFNMEKIKPESEIVIDYEYLPFGGQFQQTLVGSRLTLKQNENLKLGGTFMANWDAKTSSIPDIGASPAEIIVWEFDSDFKPLQLLPLKINPKTADIRIQTEHAKSIRNPNTYGKALIDNMQSVKEMIKASMVKNSWKYGARPPGYGAAFKGDLIINETDRVSHDPDEENKRALELDYDFNVGADSWVAMTFPLSRVALDIREMDYIEVWAKGTDNVIFGIDIGLVSEDINENLILDENDDDPQLDEDLDGDGILDTTEAFFNYMDLNIKADTYQTADGWIRYRIALSDSATYSDASQEIIKHMRLRFARKNGGADSGKIYIDHLAITGNKWEVDDRADTSFTISAINTKDDPDYAPPQAVLDLEDLDNDDFEQSLLIEYENLNDTRYAVYELYAQQRYAKYEKMKFFLYPKNGAGDTFFIRFGADENNYFERKVDINFNNEWREIEVDLNYLRQKMIDLHLDTSPPFNYNEGGYTIKGDPHLNVIKQIKIGVYGQGGSDIIYFNELYLDGSVKDEGTAKKYAVTMSFFDSLLTASGAYREKESTFQTIGLSTESGEVVPMQNKTQNISGTFQTGRVLPKKLNITAPITASYSKTENFVEPETVENVKRSDLGYSKSENKNYGVTITQSRLPKIAASHKITEAARSYRDLYDNSESKNTTVNLSKALWPTLNMAFTSSDYDKSDIARPAESKQNSAKSSAYNLTYSKSQWPSIALGYSRGTTYDTSHSDVKQTENKTHTASLNYSKTVNKLFWVLPVGESLNYSTSYGYSYKKDKMNNLHPDTKSLYDNRRVDDFKFSFNSKPHRWFSLSPSFNYSRGYRWHPVETGMEYKNRSASLNIGMISFLGFSPDVSVTKNYNERYYRRTVSDTVQRLKDISTGGTFNFKLGTDPKSWWRKLEVITLRYNYTISYSANYKEADPGVSYESVYKDYIDRVAWPWSKKDPDVTEDELSLSRNSSSNSAEHKIDGNLNIWQPLWFSYNASLRRSASQSQNTITPTQVILTGFSSRLNIKQAFPGFMKKRESNQLSLNYNYKIVKNPTQKTISHTPSLNWNIKWAERINVSFSTNYSLTSTHKQEVKSKEQKITPSLQLSYFFDKPFWTKAPLQESRIGFANRLRMDINFNYDIHTKKGDEASKINRYSWKSGLGLTYDLRDNIKASISGSFGQLKDKENKENSNYNYSATATAEIRF